jgi:hypothetical protein
MKRIAILIFIFFPACKSGTDIPEGILPATKMQSVMWDMLAADELTAYQVSMDSSVHNFQKSTALYKSIFKLNGTNEDQFRKSFRYYELHPALFKPVMDSLQKRASGITTAPSPLINYPH